MASTDDIFATHELLEAIETIPELSGAHVTGILARSSGLRTVYQGEFRGQLAVFRHQSGPDAAKIIETESKEIERVQEWMGHGANQAVRLLYSNPEIGLLIVTQATGLSIRHAIQKSPERRQELVERAALWLDAYSHPSRKKGAFPKARFLTRLGPIISKKLERRHQTLWQDVQVAMDKHAPDEGVKCVLAQTHGDFHPSNIVVDNDQVTGFDLGGSHFMPLAKDVSRFLVALQTSCPAKGVPMHFGVVKAEFEVFADVLKLDSQHRDIVLPFLIGFDILHRGPQRKKAKPDRIKRSVVMARAYLKDAT